MKSYAMMTLNTFLLIITSCFFMYHEVHNENEHVNEINTRNAINTRNETIQSSIYYTIATCQTNDVRIKKQN